MYFGELMHVLIPYLRMKSPIHFLCLERKYVVTIFRHYALNVPAGIAWIVSLFCT